MVDSLGSNPCKEELAHHRRPTALTFCSGFIASAEEVRLNPKQELHPAWRNGDGRRTTTLNSAEAFFLPSAGAKPSKTK